MKQPLPTRSANELHAIPHASRILFVLVMATAILNGHAAPAWSMPPDLGESIPKDALVSIMVDRADAPTQASAGTWLSLASVVLERGGQLGLFGPVDVRTRLIIDSLGTTPYVMRHAFNIVILDAGVRPRDDGGAELEALSMAIIVKTEGDNEGLRRRIQHLLTTHTNSHVGTMERIQIGPSVGYRLRDSRLPPWSILEWGSVGRCFVLGIGPDTFRRVAVAMTTRSERLSTTPWFLDAQRATEGTEAYFQIYLNVARIEESMAEGAGSRAAAVIRALGLEGCAQSLWSIRRKRRAIEIDGYHRYAEGNRHVPVTRASPEGFALSDIVPAGASSYLVMDRSAESFLLSIRDIYLATLREEAQAKLRRAWAREEELAGVSFQRDVLDQLGRGVVFHNDPPYMLDVPFLGTILVRVEGSAASIRRGLDATFRRLNEVYPCTLPGMTPDSHWLQQADDGVWYVQFGIVGPALAVTDDWIIIAYSPEAVRQNRDFLESRHSPTPRLP